MTMTTPKTLTTNLVPFFVFVDKNDFIRYYLI